MSEVIAISYKHGYVSSSYYSIDCSHRSKYGHWMDHTYLHFLRLLGLGPLVVAGQYALVTPGGFDFGKWFYYKLGGNDSVHYLFSVSNVYQGVRL